MTGSNPTRLRFGPFEVDLGSRELLKSGVRIKLSGQPFAILHALLERPGQLVTREELRKRIWSDDTFVDYGHGLNAAVNKLREALCDSADAPRYIETLPRRGYRFIAPVEPVEEHATAPPPPAPAPDPRQPQPAWKGSLGHPEWEATVPVDRQTLVGVSSLLAVLVLLGLGMVAYWSQQSSSVRERELRREQNAEMAEAEQKALHEKGVPEDPLQSVQSKETNGQIAQADAHRPSTKASPASGDSVISRLEHLGESLNLSSERSISEPPGILRFDLAHATEANAIKRIVTGQESIGGPQPSPDGKRLTYYMQSTDSNLEIWVCNADGSSPKKLTSMGRTGTPRWSPDGRWIAFDSDGRYGSSNIYLVPANGGQVRTVVADAGNNSVPSWSRDGKFIYFASNRGGGWEGDQVWKVPAEGGEPVQITRQGGFSAYESFDGHTLYYAKSRYENPEIWQVPVNGGPESRVTLLHPSTWASWAITDKGILLLGEYSGASSELQYFDFATRSIHSLATLEKASFWLSASANGSSVWYSELTDNQAHAVFKASLY
jgi:DNA-binding winged helix-turn-helix (wHTH) protein